MTDERDPKLQSAYRALGAEEPPRALDDAVLAASRRAAQVHPAPLVAPTGRRSWAVPLAAAAVLSLAVGVTVHMQMEQPGIDGMPRVAERERPEAVAKSDRSAGKAPAAAPSAPAAGAASGPAMAKKEAPPASAPPAAAREAPAQPAQDTVAASVAGEKTAESAAAGPGAILEAEQLERAKSAQRDAERSLAQSRGAASEMRARIPQAAPAPAMAMAKRADAPAQDVADTPERELERIAELRKQGRHDDADKALAEFRKRHPEFKIPPAMLERVERR